MQDFLYGITSYTKGFQVIARYRLWGYFLIPIILSILFGYGVFSVAWNISDDIGSLITTFYPIEFGKATFIKIANAMSSVGIIAFALLIFRYVIMAVASPFMSLLSEKIEQNLYPDSPKASFSISKFISDLLRGVRIALRNVFRELFLTLLILLLGLFLPFISPVIPVLLILLQAYYAGFGHFDYTLERRFGVRDSVRFVRANRMLALGNGMVFVLSLMTVVGFLFALPLGTAAAAVVVLES